VRGYWIETLALLALTGGSAGAGVRVLSWNVEDDAFVRHPAAFQATMDRAGADILLLDEVHPSANEAQLRAALPKRKDKAEWHIDTGQSGGPQRGVIVSRWPLERLPEFAGKVPYPDAERLRLAERMAAASESKPQYTMDEGIPVNGAIVRIGQRRLLVVTADLQCCGSDPASWQEERRRVETQEIRRRIRLVLGRTRVDGILFAGDFNLVATPLPLIYASGPYPSPHRGLIAAELYHLDGTETWTWDGRGTQFPSRILDVLLYSPGSLELREGYVFDSADLSSAERRKAKLEPGSVRAMSPHLPLVAEFAWR
jgi:endonuclease/exonuclease/phosphatase family metal-dependent hydrolase